MLFYRLDGWNWATQFAVASYLIKRYESGINLII